MKSVKYFFFISISLLYVCTFPCEAVAELVQDTEYAVVQVQYGKVTTTYEYDPNGNITRIESGPNEIILQYDDNDRLVACLGPEYNPYEQIDSDDDLGLDRVTAFRARYLNQDGAIEDANVTFTYDAIGRVVAALRATDAVNSTKWEIRPGKSDANDMERLIYEKKQASVAGVAFEVGSIKYYGYDSSGRVTKIIDGYTGDATEYRFDPCDPNRIKTITEPAGQIQYTYDTNGRLSNIDHYDDNYDSSLQYTTVDSDGDTIITIKSDTLAADPNYTRLGKLELCYDSKDMLTRIDYTADESDLAALTTICTFQYEYDSLDRLTRITCLVPDEPNLVVTIDPNINNNGDYTVVQYEYDPTTHLNLWTVNAWTLGDNALTRSVYNNLAADLDSSDRLMLEIALTAPNGIPAIISYEYDSTGKLLRSSDLGGHNTIYAEKIIGAAQTLLGGGGQYAITLGGGGSYGLFGGGGSFGLYGGGGQYYLPLGHGGGIGKMLGPFGFDEYANLDILIEQEQLPAGGDEVITRAKKKVAKKTAKKKTAPTGCLQALEGDINGDCKVNFIDVAIIANDWLCDQSP